MKEIDLWKKIAENAGKVPGLEVEIREANCDPAPYCVCVKISPTTGCHIAMEPNPNWGWIRHHEAAMFVVWGIEAAGLANFERRLLLVDFPGRSNKYQWFGHYGTPANPLWIKGENAREHLALLETIALTLDTLTLPEDEK